MFDLKNIKKKNICIIGLMGSGKSIIGKDLSKSLNLKFYDTDKEIEIMTNQTINEIFENKGESYFRKIEEKVCLDLLNHENCVISLGGGSITNSKIRKILIQNSFSIYLEVKINNLIKRLKSSKKRPLLNSNIDRKVTLENLYNERRKFYENADFVVKNNSDKIKVLEIIKYELKLYAKKINYKK